MSALTLASLVAALAAPAPAQPSQEARIKALEAKVEALAEAYEAALSQQAAPQTKPWSIGGYGELHYNNLDADGTDLVQVNMRRWVLFLGYQFSDRLRFASEFEVENTIVSPANRGAVELEQAWLAYDFSPNFTLSAGLLTVPVGIINDTHEPATFYGVNRPIIETTIIPTTWWVGGAMIQHRFDNGLSYQLQVSEGLKTDDPNTSLTADPFGLKAGKQKTSFAAANDPAVTGRVIYNGVPGLTLSAYAQYQHDLDQSAAESYADSALMVGGHVIYQVAGVKLIGLYSQWFLQGDAAKKAGRDRQGGGYLEASYRPWQFLGVFARHSRWSQAEGDEKHQTDAGLNVWPHQTVVLKFDVQRQNADAGNTNGFNLGVGYNF